ncbi:MAG: hypothetical protein COU69_03700 [Candidatus Pacebacteria bacterium CG10_big_fil_rev_8_21_14_0_10_56_10]|nr:MAG: hypothetical protein COU69_03700 [Candidatus Pacebacteria bacterium CG10_big_fil_rev_8_21_14_0_10_56_10]
MVAPAGPVASVKPVVPTRPVAAVHRLPAVAVAQAQTELSPESQPAVSTTAGEVDEATAAAEATSSANPASPSAEVEQKIQQKKDQDITETDGEQKNRLTLYLEQHPPGPLSWNNLIQHAIVSAVAQGVPANTIVLVLLFPLVASLIAASRHVIGLRGFGIYIPAVLSVALASTGVLGGLAIFVAIVVTALLTSRIIKRIKLSYLPRTALLIWTISMGVLGLMLISPLVNLVTLMSVNIFPILILILLAENFLDAQTRTKQSEAVALTAETIVLAIISAILLQWDVIRRIAITEPELVVTATAVFNILVGKFAGLRVTELLRFRSIIEEE